MKSVVCVCGLLLAFGSAATGYYLYAKHQPDQANGVAAAAQADAYRAVTGKIRPDFSLPDINGETRDIREWDGQVVALNFWATWCPPCLQEIPEFIALQDKYSDQGLQFVGIALQNADEVAEFVKQEGMNYPVLVGELEVMDLANTLGNATGTLPYTVIIDRDRRIHFIKNGRLSRDKAEQVIRKLL